MATFASIGRGASAAWIRGIVGILALALWLGPGAALGQEGGEVRLPLERFQEMAERARQPAPEPQPPVGYALSAAAVEVTAPDAPGEPATVRAVVTVEVLGPGWVVVPLLPAGTALRSAQAGGKALGLTAVGGDLVWSTDRKGEHRLELVYAVPVTVAAEGRGVTIPVPGAAAVALEATIPGEGLAVSVVPAGGVTLRPAAGATAVVADVPATDRVRLEWGAPGADRAVIVGARYAGTLRGTVMAWRAELDVLVGGADPVALPVLENTVALAAAEVDGHAAVVEEREERLAVRLRGRGAHEVVLTFETPVERAAGPSAARLWLPRPPRARFTVTLPGEKAASVEPAAGLETQRVEGQTVATVNVPPTDEVTFTWTEALPEVVASTRASAEVFHLVQAEEGVLQVRALVALEVTRGAMTTLDATLPRDVIVNRVTGDGVVDWRVADDDAGARRLTVFLDRERAGDVRYEVTYELLVSGAAKEDAALGVPLLTPGGVDRHRGMVALLAGAELEMKPGEATDMTKVGENQLPAWVRERAARTVAHTYKFARPSAALAVRLAPPERQRGRFDVAVDTLVSVGDGVVKATATLAVTVKSGRLMDLAIALPPGVNVLSVTAPSLRDHEVTPGAGAGEDGDGGGDGGTLALMFTQEMEGTLRVEVSYELLLPAGEERVAVPALHVPAADMEQGRLAVEALTAVEVRAAEVERALPVDVQELPRQLTLRTTNPILLAYTYVHADPPFRLVLDVRRHAETMVQVAAIDDARYETLFTQQGLALTRATWRVRNRRKQFLTVTLPQGSELWSAQLANQPVKAAVGEGEGVILVPLVNSATPFPVEIVFATPVPRLGPVGWLRGELPVPDIVETQSTWDVFLPDDFDYGRVKTNMRPLAVPARVEPIDTAASDALGGMAGELAQGIDTEPDGDVSARLLDGNGTFATAQRDGAARGVLPLRIEVPRRGVHYRFERLFSNRGDDRAQFSVHYATAGARTSGGLVLALALAALVGAALAAARGARRGPWLTGAAAVAAAVLSVTLLDAAWGWALAGAAAAALATVARRVLAR